jgi:hypothetical protein
VVSKVLVRVGHDFIFAYFPSQESLTKFIPMSKLYKVYLKSIEKNIKVFTGNWLPGTPRELGDYGTVDKDLFTRIGNIKDLGITFETLVDPSADLYNFSAGTSSEFSGDASATAGNAVVSANAAVKITFSKNNTVYFNAAGCETNSVGNTDTMEADIKAGDKADKFKWKNSYHVITSVVNAGRTIVAVSTSSSAGITFTAKSPEVKKVNLSDASMDLSMTSSNAVGLTIDAQEGLQPLMVLMKVRGTFA